MSDISGWTTSADRGGIVGESGPGFSTKPAKVQLMLRKHVRTTFGPKAAKAPPFQACPKAAKASRHTWYVGTGPKHTRTASQPPWDPLGHITPAAKSLPHEGEGLRTQRQVRPVRWLHVTRSSVDRLTRKRRAKARRRKIGLWLRKPAKVTSFWRPKAAKAAPCQIWPKTAKVNHLPESYYPPVN